MATYKEYLAKIVNGDPLSEQDFLGIFQSVFAGQWTEAQLAALFVGLHMRGEDEHVLSAAAQQMRKHALRIDIPEDLRPLNDNCGTGGDGANTFNISTAAAIVASTCGARMAKHGNRSISSQCGSADLLEALGYPLTLKPAANMKLLAETRFCFLFAPGFHPAMAHIMPVRKALGIRTIFNLLGPLANPLKPESQVIGVANRSYLAPMAKALQKLGCQHGCVLSSEDGLDEISPAANTHLVHVTPSKLSERVLQPADWGIQGSLDDIRGGDAHRNAQLFEDMLRGKEGVLSRTVCLNAALTLFMQTEHADKAFSEGIKHFFDQCQQALQSGKVMQHFDRIVDVARSLN